MEVKTHLTDHNGLERPHTGSSGITATSIKRGEDTQVWFEYDFDTRDEAIFLLGGLLIRILEESGDHLLISEAVSLYVTKTGDTLPARLIQTHQGHSMDIQWSEEDQVYVVRVPTLPGCMTHGKTYTEAIQQGRDAIESWLSWKE